MVTRRASLKQEREGFTKTCTLELEKDAVYVEEVTSRGDDEQSREWTLTANSTDALRVLFEREIEKLRERGFALVSDEKLTG